jgi:putative ABC transport system permease protein
MSRLRRLLGGFGALFRRQQSERELDDELRAYLETSISEKVRAGMGREAAARAARIEMGSLEAVKDHTRDAGWESLVENTWQDVRYSIRSLRHSLGFAVTAVLTLALGIGANAAMFAVVNAVLLKPLPFSDPERLMLVHLTLPDSEVAHLGGLRENTWSYAKYRAFLEVQQTFDSAAIFAGRDFTLAGDGDPEQVRGEVISEGYDALLGVVPTMGRSFTEEEAHRPGASAVAIIGHGLWTRRYGKDPAILGRAIQVNSTPYTVVGVLPAGFRGLTGEAEIWTPVAVFEPSMLSQRGNHSYYVVARRKSDIGERAAIAAVRDYGKHVGAQFSDRPRGVESDWGASAASLYDSRADADVRRAAYVLLGGVGFLLLIASVNLTSLLVAKGLARRREVAVRLAIGASRGRIARQLLTESLLVAIAGGAAGLVLAQVFLAGAGSLLPDANVFFDSPIAPGVPRIAGAAGLTRLGASMIDLDAYTLVFTCLVTALTGAVIALVPAMHASSLRPADAMKAGGRANTGRGFHTFSLRTGLVTAQTALTLVLLAAAGLMVKSTARLLDTGIGVNAKGVMTARVDLPSVTYDREKGSAFFAQLTKRVRLVPGVESVGLGSCPPVSGGCSATSIQFRHRAAPGESDLEPVVGLYRVTPDYFSALGIQLVHGRRFDEHDRADQRKVALVNEAAARTFWPNDSPIGKVIALGITGFGDGAEVIGVVANVRYRTIETAPTPDVYVPAAQAYQSRMRLFVRTRLNPDALAGAIRAELRVLDRTLPLGEVKSMEARVGEAMWRTRVAAWLLSTFAGLALLLTAIGLFGVMAQTVTERTPEIGVRIALGARSSDVVRLVLGRAMFSSLIGIAIGITLSLGATRVLTALLYEVYPYDPSTLLFVSMILGIVALIASCLPVLRALRVDPLMALRYE